MAHLQCEMAIIRLTNFDTYLPPGNLFVRYYVSAGGGRRIRIDTREVSSINCPVWDERALLECQGASDTIGQVLGKCKIVFELRWRSRVAPIFGAKAKSRLLGRAEAAWDDAVEAMDLSVEKKVSLAMKSSMAKDLKPPALLVRMRVRVGVRVLEATKNRRIEQYKECNECRCKNCSWNGSEEDMFLAAAAVNVW